MPWADSKSQYFNRRKKDKLYLHALLAGRYEVEAIDWNYWRTRCSFTAWCCSTKLTSMQSAAEKNGLPSCYLYVSFFLAPCHNFSLKNLWTPPKELPLEMVFKPWMCYFQAKRMLFQNYLQKQNKFLKERPSTAKQSIRYDDTSWSLWFGSFWRLLDAARLPSTSSTRHTNCNHTFWKKTLSSASLR